MRQESTTTRAASYAVRDGDIINDYLPREETGSDRNEDVHMCMRPYAKTM